MREPSKTVHALEKRRREVPNRFQVTGQGLIDELDDLGFRPMVFERGFDGRNRDARRMNDADERTWLRAYPFKTMDV